MRTTSAIVELRSRPGGDIIAVPYRSRRPGRAQRLPDGQIVEAPTPEERSEVPDLLDDCVGLASSGGGLATTHHANLGLVTAYLPLGGIYRLPSGEVAAVYGARAVPLG